MKVENYDLNILKQIIDALLNRLDKGFIFIANINNGSIFIGMWCIVIDIKVEF